MHRRTLDLAKAAVRSAREPEPPFVERHGAVPVSAYTDPAVLAAERARLFRRMPVPLAHAGELVTPHGWLVRDLAGVSVILGRGEDGAVRGFLNACRHRGARLVREDCRAKALVCPYHGWTYDRGGALMHVPHLKAFPSLDMASTGLVPVTVEERHGLVWVTLERGGPTVAEHLGEIGEELDALGFASSVVARRVVSEQRGNWKMLMEAFLDGYHIRTLHRDTIYPFFLDARSVAERSGLHVRASTARRAAKQVADDAGFDARASSDPDSVRDLVTPSYTIFPCTTLVLHPDWTSLILAMPIAPDRFLWSHTQLLASEPESSEARAHFERTFDLIEKGVFQSEDLRIVAETQLGIETGANEVLTFGSLEGAALWFHDALGEAMAR